jgi:PAS domain S-box-containing protein
MSVDMPELVSLRRENEELRRRITELEQRPEGQTLAEEQARREAQLGLFEQALNKLPICVIILDADGSARFVNDLFCKQFSLTREEVVGKYTIYQDNVALERGYVAAFERALRSETVSMDPVLYDSSKTNIEWLKSIQVWTQMIYVPFEVPGGARYVLALNVDVTEQKLAEGKVRERERLLQAILDHSPLGIYAKDLEGRYILTNRTVCAIVGMSGEQIEGKTDYDLFPKEVADKYARVEKEVLATKKPIQIEDYTEVEDKAAATVTVKFPLLDEQGNAYGVCSATLDVTERRRTEEENRKLQEEMLRVQEAALRALSTPLIPIAKGVLAMPLIGDITQARAGQVLETLLRGVARSRARVAILDVTGVTSAGSEVVDGLIRASRAVRLLGARMVLTGVQPPMAQRIASLGEDLGDILTLGTLESGIAYALRAP